MKELSVEEKAKAYDKALKIIKDNLDALNEITETGAEIVNIQAIKNCFYRAFPSLKDKYTWKPSDEQLHYLHWIANVKLGDSVVEQEVSKHLNELYEDLKKLKGE